MGSGLPDVLGCQELTEQADPLFVLAPRAD